ncbi:ABC transporter permease [Cytophagaceae bacterium DM2B3-1]|uniref:ABC transporter permease n=1 Tax=Xanthocytophaga flava TaxID=3048013 RepID=A0ABT7CMN9_9BACT|nr:ABC transporter permease [Xanthocytophaga flavus]MDJ1493944.1 ABC transporter permease [Xanthocytophaga flavus]
MLRNYFKIAMRNLWRNKGFSATNIFGLSIGIATCLLIMLYVLDEISYDRFYSNADRIYRLNSDIKFGGNQMRLAVMPAPTGAALVRDYPLVEAAARIRQTGSILVKKGNENIKEDGQNVGYADSTIFKVFSFPMLYGNPDKALTEPHTLVISERIAQKYFGESDVVGKTMILDDKQPYKIAGVIQNIPTNSHLKVDFFLTMLDHEDSKIDNWVSHNYTTYLLLKEGVKPAQVEAVFDNLLLKYVGPQIKQAFGSTLNDLKKSGSYLNYSMMPVSDIHLYSDRVAEVSPNSNVQYVYIFSAVAFFILLIACINFMNLATARSANRAKEVGVRKVLGSYRSSLIYQFLTESILLTGIAFVLALGIGVMLLPLFNDLAGKQMTMSVIEHPLIIPILLLFTLFTGLLAGSYPAFFLSAFEPIQVLKGKLSQGAKSSSLRSSLVVFQFLASVFLIICTVVIYQQLTFIQNKQLGFNKEQVLIINDASALGNSTESFKNEVLRLEEVKNGTITGYLPVPSWRSDNLYFPEGEIRQDKAVSIQSWNVDYDYIQTMGMQIIKGRDFDKQLQTDSSGIIINETAAKLFGYSNPIGRRISALTDFKTQQTRAYTIVGVVKNFNFESLRQNIGAVCFTLGNAPGNVSFRLNTANISATISKIEAKWKTIAPGQPFNYQFMDEAFTNVYQSEQKVGKLFITFALLAIFIACLGLFGLSAYSAEQRTKEIGIRKVLGASISNIVALLSKDFLKLILIANGIAFPLAYWAMSTWLQDFAFKVNIQWWVFLIAGIAALLIALLTVSFQAIKAALINPVKSLRSE